MADARAVWAGRLLAAGLAAIALAGCSQKALLQKFSSPQDRALGLRVIGDLQRGPAGDEDLKGLLDPRLRGQIVGVLPQMRAALPRGSQPELVGANLNVSASTSEGSRRDATLAWRLAGGGQKSLVRMVITTTGQQTRITSLYVLPEGAAAPATAPSGRVET